MKNYLLLIMLIIGSFGGLVIADNYGALDGMTEGGLDPDYADDEQYLYPYDDGASPYSTFGLFPQQPMIYEAVSGENEATLTGTPNYYQFRDYDSVTRTGSFKITKPPSSGDSEIAVQFYINVPENPEYNNFYGKWDFYDLYLYTYIFVEGTGLEDCELFYIDRNGQPIKLADIIPGETLEINGLELHHAFYFKIAGTLTDINTWVHIDQLNIVPIHGGVLSDAGTPWKHEISDNPGSKEDSNTESGEYQETESKLKFDFTYNFDVQGGYITESDSITFNFDYWYEVDGWWKDVLGTWIPCDTSWHWYKFNDDNIHYTGNEKEDNFYHEGSHSWSDTVDEAKRRYSFSTTARGKVISIYHEKCRVKQYCDPKSETWEFYGYGFSNLNYPSISNIRVTPEVDPIGSDFQIEFVPQCMFKGANIESAEVLLLHTTDDQWNEENAKWFSAKPSTDNYHYLTDYDEETTNLDWFPEYKFTPGEYVVWVKVTDTLGHSSYKQKTISFMGSTPVALFEYEDRHIFTELKDVEVAVQVLATQLYHAYGVNFTLYERVYDEDSYTDIKLTEWTPMNPLGDPEDPNFDDYWKIMIDPIDWGNGNYSFGIRLRTPAGASITKLPVIFDNKPPDIDFGELAANPTIIELDEYDLKVKIEDREKDEFANVSLSFYNLTADLEIDEQVTPWYNMTNILDDGVPTEYWNCTINPTNFSNGDYYVAKVRVNSTYGWNYEILTVLFQRLQPTIMFLYESGDPPYAISRGDVFYPFTVRFIQGQLYTSRIDWVIAEDSQLNRVIQYGGEEYKSGQNEYTFNIEPRLLQNKKYYLGVRITNLTDYKLPHQKTEVYVDYFLNNSYDEFNVLIPSYEFSPDVVYEKDDVVTNAYIDATSEIYYVSGTRPHGYNYKFELEYSKVLDYAHDIYPDYRIFHNSEETPDPYLSSPDTLYFEFNSRPSEDTDLLHFNMATPDFGFTDEDGKIEYNNVNGIKVMEIKLELSAVHHFTSLHCIFSPFVATSEVENYEYSLYVLDKGEYVRIDIPVEFTLTNFQPRWQFTLPEVAKDGPETIGFMIEGIPTSTEDINFGPIIFAAMAGGVVGVLSLYFVPQKTSLLKKSRTLRKKKWIYYLIAGCLTGGIGIGVFFGTSVMGAMLISPMI